MTKYIYSIFDKYKAYFAIAALVLCGGLVAGGPMSFYYQYQSNESELRQDKRVKAVVDKHEALLKDRAEIVTK